jgi:hypothetical protein
LGTWLCRINVLSSGLFSKLLLINVFMRLPWRSLQIRACKKNTKKWMQLPLTYNNASKVIPVLCMKPVSNWSLEEVRQWTALSKIERLSPYTPLAEVSCARVSIRFQRWTRRDFAGMRNTARGPGVLSPRRSCVQLTAPHVIEIMVTLFDGVGFLGLRFPPTMITKDKTCHLNYWTTEMCMW